jgi:hypothetical protein
MNKFVTTALGLAAVGSVGMADPGDSEWLGLDSEINHLASTLTPARDGMGWSFLMRIAYVYSSDDIATDNFTGSPFGGEDISGFDFNDLDLAFWGSVGDFGWRLSMDLLGEDHLSAPIGLTGYGLGNLSADAGDEIQIEDAYAYWDCGEYFTAKMGNFKAPVLRSASLDPENTLFIDRTILGSAFDFWDTGIMASGEQSGFRWAFAMQDGRTTAVSLGLGTPSINANEEVDHFYSLRVEFDLGEGGGSYEGSRGGNDDLNATIGVSIVNDDTISVPGTPDGDDTSFFVDFSGSVGAIGFGAEVALLDDDVTYAIDPDYGHINPQASTNLLLMGDSTPWALTLSYLLNPDWEVGVRYESLDNGDVTFSPVGGTGADNTVSSVVVTHYRSGNNAKWQAQYTSVSEDGPAGSTFDDGGYFQVGLTLGASR